MSRVERNPRAKRWAIFADFSPCSAELDLMRVICRFQVWPIIIGIVLAGGTVRLLGSMPIATENETPGRQVELHEHKMSSCWTRPLGSIFSHANLHLNATSSDGKDRKEEVNKQDDLQPSSVLICLSPPLSLSSFSARLQSSRSRCGRNNGQCR